MMRVLGNRLTYHSPSRGFSMEMGAAITVLIAARNGIPVSTTNCIVGSTVGVGIASGGFKNVNWKLAGFTLLTWIFTVPTTAVVSGALYAFGTFTPSFFCTKYTVQLSFTQNGTVVPSNMINATTKLSIKSNMLPQFVDAVTKVPGDVTGTNLDKTMTFCKPIKTPFPSAPRNQLTSHFNLRPATTVVTLASNHKPPTDSPGCQYMT